MREFGGRGTEFCSDRLRGGGFLELRCSNFLACSFLADNIIHIHGWIRVLKFYTRNRYKTSMNFMGLSSITRPIIYMEIYRYIIMIFIIQILNLIYFFHLYEIVYIYIYDIYYFSLLYFSILFFL